MIEKKFEEAREKLLHNLAECGLIEEQQPQEKNYDYIFILGGLQTTMQKRIQFVENLINNKKIKVKNIVLFGGLRPTDKNRENNELGKNEAESFEALYQKSTLKNHPYTLVVASMKKNAEGKDIRPDTDDTVIAWLNTNPQPGSALVVANQPYNTRQTLVFKTLLPDTFKLEAAGYGSPKTEPISLFLDELARTVYQQLTYNKQHSSQ